MHVAVAIAVTCTSLCARALAPGVGQWGWPSIGCNLGREPAEKSRPCVFERDSDHRVILIFGNHNPAFQTHAMTMIVFGTAFRRMIIIPENDLAFSGKGIFTESTPSLHCNPKCQYTVILNGVIQCVRSGKPPVRGLPSKFGRRSGPCQSMALREQIPSNFTGRPAPTDPACSLAPTVSRGVHALNCGDCRRGE